MQVASAALMADTDDGPRKLAGVRGTRVEIERWQVAAKKAGFEEFAPWARMILDAAAAKPHGVADPPSDTATARDLAFLQKRYPHLDTPAEVLRAAVRTAAARERLVFGSAFAVDVVARDSVRMAGGTDDPARDRKRR